MNWRVYVSPNRGKSKKLYIVAMCSHVRTIVFRHLISRHVHRYAWSWPSLGSLSTPGEIEDNSWIFSNNLFPSSHRLFKEATFGKKPLRALHYCWKLRSIKKISRLKSSEAECLYVIICSTMKTFLQIRTSTASNSDFSNISFAKQSRLRSLDPFSSSVPSEWLSRFKVFRTFQTCSR